MAVTYVEFGVFNTVIGWCDKAFIEWRQTRKAEFPLVIQMLRFGPHPTATEIPPSRE
jgi:hypothetical protein